MGKKRFIDKRKATTYSVVHRSQQDGQYGIEDRPSERVLLAQPRTRRSEVTALGLPEDGYDYEKHLRPLGGGTFVSADGTVETITMPAPLPAEALPGVGEELAREVDAVTLDPRYMDADVRDALFDDAAFGDCEELLDDFVVEAAQAPEGEDAPFDYDAHVARLIAAAGGGDEDEDEDDSYDCSEWSAPAGCEGGGGDEAFDAALADYDTSDDEEDLEEGVARIALDDEAVLGAMLDESIKDRAAAAGGAAFLDPERGARRPEGLVEDQEPGTADRELDALYAAEDAAFAERLPRWDCESILSTAS
eukprot:CAMPEP_0119280080 /NCGR_PEP_ID=MMETSP1329-20130426/22030_1 /TAXON_ID=114041 /ORGANISM="Genus nov. species nov., Strain RCC1024" /LENGTH=305 /DNA_ID=CAMNT_0007280651 /DNA_START=77 /DNA_END=991 /DNA_ORIENTATION=+